MTDLTLINPDTTLTVYGHVVMWGVLGAWVWGNFALSQKSLARKAREEERREKRVVREVKNKIKEILS